ncbi:hypothetical protein CCH79_00009364 [Gambusia affinis]|uniref:Uncharacterized protein n=1 Tax=Gambusia affinis TaxID=33528 RepID=A0A315VDQ3_GAMAF|nr:hypothetical protein CCH79_00009364 [Gambusia affinis]
MESELKRVTRFEVDCIQLIIKSSKVEKQVWINAEREKREAGRKGRLERVERLIRGSAGGSAAD